MTWILFTDSLYYLYIVPAPFALRLGLYHPLNQFPAHCARHHDANPVLQLCHHQQYLDCQYFLGQIERCLHSVPTQIINFYFSMIVLDQKIINIQLFFITNLKNIVYIEIILNGIIFVKNHAASFPSVRNSRFWNGDTCVHFVLFVGAPTGHLMWNCCGRCCEVLLVLWNQSSPVLWLAWLHEDVTKAYEDFV